MKPRAGRQANAQTGAHAAWQSGSAGRQMKAHTGRQDETSKCAHRQARGPAIWQHAARRSSSIRPVLFYKSKSPNNPALPPTQRLVVKSQQSTLTFAPLDGSAVGAFWLSGSWCHIFSSRCSDLIPHAGKEHYENNCTCLPYPPCPSTSIRLVVKLRQSTLTFTPLDGSAVGAFWLSGSWCRIFSSRCSDLILHAGKEQYENNCTCLPYPPCPSTNSIRLVVKLRQSTLTFTPLDGSAVGAFWLSGSWCRIFSSRCCDLIPHAGKEHYENNCTCLPYPLCPSTNSFRLVAKIRQSTLTFTPLDGSAVGAFWLSGSWCHVFSSRSFDLILHAGKEHYENNCTCLPYPPCPSTNSIRLVAKLRQSTLTFTPLDGSAVGAFWLSGSWCRIFSSRCCDLIPHAGKEHYENNCTCLPYPPCPSTNSIRLVAKIRQSTLTFTPLDGSAVGAFWLSGSWCRIFSSRSFDLILHAGKEQYENNCTCLPYPPCPSTNSIRLVVKLRQSTLTFTPLDGSAVGAFWLSGSWCHVFSSRSFDLILHAGKEHYENNCMPSLPTLPFHQLDPTCCKVTSKHPHLHTLGRLGSRCLLAFRLLVSHLLIKVLRSDTACWQRALRKQLHMPLTFTPLDGSAVGAFWLSGSWCHVFSSRSFDLILHAGKEHYENNCTCLPYPPCPSTNSIRLVAKLRQSTLTFTPLDGSAVGAFWLSGSWCRIFSSRCCDLIPHAGKEHYENNCTCLPYPPCPSTNSIRLVAKIRQSTLTFTPLDGSAVGAFWLSGSWCRIFSSRSFDLILHAGKEQYENNCTCLPYPPCPSTNSIRLVVKLRQSTLTFTPLDGSAVGAFWLSGSWCHVFSSRSFDLIPHAGKEHMPSLPTLPFHQLDPTCCKVTSKHPHLRTLGRLGSRCLLAFRLLMSHLLIKVL